MKRRRFTEGLLAGMLLPCLPVVVAGSRWLPTPDLPDVALVDQHGRSVEFRPLLRASPVAVSFMFTGCNTVCPPQTALLRSALEAMRGDPRLRPVRALSISITPVMDTPDQLRAYAQKFRLPTAESWTLLTGEERAVARVAGAFDVSLARPSDHSALLWLGDTRRDRWTRCSSLSPPSAVVSLFSELLS